MDNQPLRALFLNCTLKYSPEISNTEALMDKLIDRMKEIHDDLHIDKVRVNDYNIRYGIGNDMGNGDEWPIILEKVKTCDILVICTPIWMGVRASIAQIVIERLDGTTKGDEAQFVLYNTVAGMVITGNEDGIHDVAANTFFNLAHFGCTIPPNTDLYWVGDAGPGASYIEARGDLSPYVNRNTELTARNLIHGALMLKKFPYTVDMRPLKMKLMQGSKIKMQVMKEANQNFEKRLQEL